MEIKMINWKNPEEAKKYYKEYYQKNKEKKRLQNKEWNKNNPEKNKEYQRRYYQKNREIKKIRTQKWRERNREKFNEYARKLYKKIVSANREEFNKKRAIYHKKYCKLNPEKIYKWTKKSRLNHPEKYKARTYAYNNNQRNSKCSQCGVTEDLHFHHTNYELNEGITLCRNCHFGKHRIH